MTPEQREWHAQRLTIALDNAKPAHEVDWDSDRWPNFTPHEIACRGTGRLYVDPVAMDKLQGLRDMLGAAFTPTSAYRSPEHNRAIGGATRSMHLLGIAFDIPLVAPMRDMVRLAQQAGFNAIGRYSSRHFIHVDDRYWEASWGR